MIKKYYEFINESNQPDINEIFYHGTPNEFDVKDIKLPSHFGTKQAATNESFKLPNDIKYEYIDNDKGVIIGIEVKYYNKLIASISFGVMDERYTPGYPKDDLEFNDLVYGHPFITNISVLEEYQEQGLATKLYEKAFEELRKQGCQKVFSGLTRNSMYVNNIWNRFADGYELIGDRQIYYKNL